jgi:hypothetical protein
MIWDWMWSGLAIRLTSPKSLRRFIDFDHVVLKGRKECYHPILVDFLSLYDEPVAAGGLVVRGADAHNLAPDPRMAFDTSA